MSINLDQINLIEFECRICGRKNVNKLVINNCESEHERKSGMSVEEIRKTNDELYKKNKTVITAMKNG